MLHVTHGGGEPRSMGFGIRRLLGSGLAIEIKAVDHG